MDYIGEVAALATAFFFAGTAIIFTLSGRLVGSQITNRVRLLCALIYLVSIHLILFRTPLPFGASFDRWIWLSISGVLGLALGDAFLFQALVQIGPRLSSLLMSLAPVIGAGIAWIFFGETLSLGQSAGIVVALIGIGFVVASHRAPDDATHGSLGRGVLFGILAAVGQAVGLVFSKQGMTGDFSPFSGNLIRILAAAIFMWAWTGFRGEVPSTVTTLKLKPRALGWIALGALIGPVLGVSGSLLAVQHAKVGVASTLIALSPILVLPYSYFVFREKFGWQAIVGPVIAMTGVAMLFLV